MVEVILNPYDLYTTPINNLSTLEDVIEKGYDCKIEHQETVSLTVREHPIAVSFAIDSLIHQKVSNYFSFIQRHAVLYGISLISKDIDAIADKFRSLSNSGSIRELRDRLKSNSGLSFDTTTENDIVNIYMPAWCKEWVHSNCRYLNMPAGRLAIYSTIIALNRSNIINLEVSKSINYEAVSFLKYIENMKN